MGVPASVFELLAPKHEKNGAIFDQPCPFVSYRGHDGLVFIGLNVQPFTSSAALLYL